MWLRNVDNAQSRQWQDPVFSHAGTASYPQSENETTSLIADRRHSLFGHICRHLENTPASQALQLSIEAHTSTPPATDWKSPPGRPRRNWLQQVEKDIGLSVGAARISGQDRSMWRTLRPSAGQAQQWVSEGYQPVCPSTPVILITIKYCQRLIILLSLIISTVKVIVDGWK